MIFYHVSKKFWKITKCRIKTIFEFFNMLRKFLWNNLQIDNITLFNIRVRKVFNNFLYKKSYVRI